MDILTTTTIDLSEFGIDASLKFTNMDSEELRDYRKEVDKIKKDEEIIDVMMRIVKEHFVEGTVKKEDGNHVIKELGKIDAKVLAKVFREISGQEDKKK